MNTLALNRISSMWPTPRTNKVGSGSSSIELLEHLGFVSRTDVAGVFGLLPLGMRVRDNLLKITADAYSQQGFSRVGFPTLQSRSIWEASGRWGTYRDQNAMFTVLDADDDSLCLPPTSEEIAVSIVSRQLRSYRDLPARLWLSSSKFRNELSPRGGLMRGREFEMADGYTFDIDERGMIDSYNRLGRACSNALRGMGFSSIFPNPASGGEVSDFESTEFLVLGDSGQGAVWVCSFCGARDDGDLRLKGILEATLCSECGPEKVIKLPAIELAHIFQLKDKYTFPMNLRFVGKDGMPATPMMSCSGIGITRCIQALADSFRDERGLIWPEQSSPFDVHVVSLRYDVPEVRNRTEEIATALVKSGLTVLIDDTNSSAGNKFAIADGIGIPRQIVVSERTNDKFEVRNRSSGRVYEEDLMSFVNGYINSI